MWFYSGKGDEGEADLFDGRRLPKNSPEFELMGILDEATAALGLAISFSRDENITGDLVIVQDDLSKLMGIVAGAGPAAIAGRFDLEERLKWIELRIRNYGEFLDNPHQFVYAGKTSCGAAIDIARTIIRKAERKFIKVFDEEGEISKNIPYLNRLSSFLFAIRLFVDNNPQISR